MNKGIYKFTVFIFSVIIFTTVLFLYYCFAVKVVFVQDKTELLLEKYKCNVRYPFVIVKTDYSDIEKLKSVFLNVKYLLSPIAFRNIEPSFLLKEDVFAFDYISREYDNVAIYSTEVLFENLLSVTEGNTIVLKERKDAFDYSGFLIETREYDDRISALEVGSYDRYFKNHKVKNIITLYPEQVYPLFELDEYDFYFPKGFLPEEKKSNLHPFSPDVDKMIELLRKKDTSVFSSQLSYKID